MALNPAFAAAIGKIESDGNYGILGPKLKSGDQAYGKYQVMGSNIGPWTKEVLGVELTPQQFLANPQAQDAVFEGKFGQYLSKYGTPQDAASVWFSGRPLAKAGNASDGYNTVPQYVAKFNAALGSQQPQPIAGPAPQQPQQQVAQQPAQPTQQPQNQQAPPGLAAIPPQIQLPQDPIQNQPIPTLGTPTSPLQQLAQQINFQRAFQKIPVPAGFRGFSYS